MDIQTLLREHDPLAITNLFHLPIFSLVASSFIPALLGEQFIQRSVYVQGSCDVDRLQSLTVFFLFHFCLPLAFGQTLQASQTPNPPCFPSPSALLWLYSSASPAGTLVIWCVTGVLTSHSTLSALSAVLWPEALSRVASPTTLTSGSLAVYSFAGTLTVRYDGALATHPLNSVPAGAQHVEPYHTAHILSVSLLLLDCSMWPEKIRK